MPCATFGTSVFQQPSLDIMQIYLFYHYKALARSIAYISCNFFSAKWHHTPLREWATLQATADVSHAALCHSQPSPIIKRLLYKTCLYLSIYLSIRTDRRTDAQRQAASIHRRLALGTISWAPFPGRRGCLSSLPLPPWALPPSKNCVTYTRRSPPPLQQPTLAWPTKSLPQVCNVSSAPCPGVQPLA
jgi:hypothetical protein